MTLLRLSFAGQIKRADTKNVGGKDLIEVSLCRKQKGRAGAEDTFAWIKVSIWEPAAFQVPKLVKGAFIAGSGEFSARSYDGKDGKATSMEVRCSSFDVEVESGGGEGSRDEHPAKAAPRQQAPIGGGADDSEPPFQRIGREYQC